MEEEQKPEPKISLPEVIIVGGFILLVDIIDLIGAAFGIPMSDATDILAWPATQLYTFLKGVRGLYMLLSNALEAIPYLGSLPLRTVGFAITVYLDRHPKLERGATAIAGAIQGKIGAPAEAGEGVKAPAGGPKPAGVPTGELEPAKAGAGRAPLSQEAGMAEEIAATPRMIDVERPSEAMQPVMTSSAEKPPESEVVKEAMAAPPRGKTEPAAGEGPKSFEDVLKLTSQPPEGFGGEAAAA